MPYLLKEFWHWQFYDSIFSFNLYFFNSSKGLQEGLCCYYGQQKRANKDPIPLICETHRNRLCHFSQAAYSFWRWSLLRIQLLEFIPLILAFHWNALLICRNTCICISSWQSAIKNLSLQLLWDWIQIYTYWETELKSVVIGKLRSSR